MSSRSISLLNRAAIVTGAAGSLGRQYALGLALHGASVLLCEIPAAKQAAEKLMTEIKEMGGNASVCLTPLSEGEKVVDQCVRDFDSVDIVVNNAGILRDRSFLKASEEDWTEVMDVHLHGSWQILRYCWPYFHEQQYGRIINISSGAALYGNFGQSSYSAAKMAVIGLSKTLAIEGAKQNILTNTVAPIARSDMTESVLPPDILRELDPQHIVPLVVYLSSESCTENNQIYEAGGGWYSKIRLARSKGVKLGSGATYASADEIAAYLPSINDFSQHSYPTSPADALQHLAQEIIKSDSKDRQNLNSLSSPSFSCSLGDGSNGENGKLIVDMVKNMQAGIEALACKVVLIKIDKDTWEVAFSEDGTPRVQKGSSGTRANTTIITTGDAFIKIFKKRTLSPEWAYATGSMKIDGNIKVARTLSSHFFEIMAEI